MWRTPPTVLMNKVCNKETNEPMHGRNIRSRRDLNHGCPEKSQYHNQVRILPDAVVKYCI